MIRDVVTVRDRIRIHYRRQGLGPGMVLLHGYPQTGHMWHFIPEEQPAAVIDAILRFVGGPPKA